MIEVTNIKVVGIEDALRGMRNPKDSWNLSDSKYFRTLEELSSKNVPIFGIEGSKNVVLDIADANESIEIDFENSVYVSRCGSKDVCNIDEYYEMLIKTDDFALIGPADLKLCKQLIHGGPVHSKFARMICVYMDISASFDFWKEYDTYKVATVANSCSTMHTVHKHELDISNFSLADLTNKDIEYIKEKVIPYLNSIIGDNDIPDIEVTRRISKLNILGFQQKRTVLFNYETLHNMITWRSNHKLFEWRYLTNVVLKKLPYVKSFYL